MAITDRHGDEQPKSQAEGCGFIALFVLAVVWIGGLTIITQLINWTIEQAISEASYNVTDFRWIMMLVFALGTAVPMLILALKSRKPRPKQIYWTWFGASIFALLMVPTRLVWLAEAQVINLIQIAMTALFIAGYWTLTQLRKERSDTSSGSGPIRGIGLAVLLGVAMSLPWALWGAAGSLLDTVLNLAVGLLTGVAAALVLNDSLLQFSQHPSREYRVADFIMDGLVASVMLVIMMTGLGVPNLSPLLIISVALVSWTAVGVNLINRDKHNLWKWLPMAVVIGLATAIPLMMVDGDELALVFTGNSGDLLTWAYRAGWVTAAINVLVGLIAMFNLKQFQREQPAWRGQAVMAMLGIGVWAAVWAAFGQVGFFGERLFVIMEKQADTAQFAALPYSERRQAVFTELVTIANGDQEALRAQLDQRGYDYTSFYLVNAIEVRGDIFARWWLAKQPGVDRVLSSPHLRPLPQSLELVPGEINRAPEEVPWNIKFIGADRVRDDLGITGQGILIGQADSGVDANHPEVADSWLGRDGQLDGTWLDPWYGSQRPVDISGHGTHTLGTILGNTVGIAPEADWIGCVNLARNQGNPALYVTCMQFLFAPYGQTEDAFLQGDPSIGAMVLNNSWGCPESEGCDNRVMQSAVHALRDAGVFVAVSAGNSGVSGCGSISEPLALFDEVFSVGAVDSNGQLADFSSLGPVIVDGSNRIKPDLAAPGVDVLSAYPQGRYELFSGTSMAGPHVTGTVALMWSANPALIGDIETTERILRETAKPYTGTLPECVGQSTPNEAVGYGILDAYAAVKMALSLK